MSDKEMRCKYNITDTKISRHSYMYINSEENQRQIDVIVKFFVCDRRRCVGQLQLCE